MAVSPMRVPLAVSGFRSAVARSGTGDRIPGQCRPPGPAVARAWRQSSEDFGPCFLHCDPESQTGDDFGWGLCRYAADWLPSLNLAFAILCDFYGRLSWADFEITDAPYSQKRWAQQHAPAFLGQTIVHLPRGKPWTIGDTDMQSALREIVPASFPRR